MVLSRRDQNLLCIVKMYFGVCGNALDALSDPTNSAFIAF
tara:strand:+ start:213 stop:332 length:120 start_codon:yes stop_codon:yes gene_type:complete